jgi:hypothetical protein
MPPFVEHRIRTSLGRSAAVAPSDDKALRALAADAWRVRGVAVFFEDQQIGEPARMAIEEAATKLYGERAAR